MKKKECFLIILFLVICFLVLGLSRGLINNIWFKNEKGNSGQENGVDVTNNEIKASYREEESPIVSNYIYFENNSVKVIDKQLNKNKLIDDYIEVVYEDDILYYALSNKYLYTIDKITLKIKKYNHNFKKIEFGDENYLSQVREMIVINGQIYLYGVSGSRDDTYYLMNEYSELLCFSFQDGRLHLESKVSEHILDLYYYDNMIYYISYNETDAKIKLSRINLLTNIITSLCEESVEIKNNNFFALKDVSDNSIVYEMIAETGDNKYDEELDIYYTELESHFYLYDFEKDKKMLVPIVNDIKVIEPNGYETINIGNHFSYNFGKEILSRTNLNGLKIETVEGYEITEYDLLVLKDLINEFDIISLDITNSSFKNATIPEMAFVNVDLYNLLPFTGASNEFVTFDTIEKGAFWGLHTFDRELLIPSNVKNISSDSFLDRTSEKILLKKSKSYPNQYTVYKYEPVRNSRVN